MDESQAIKKGKHLSQTGHEETLSPDLEFLTTLIRVQRRYLIIGGAISLAYGIATQDLFYVNTGLAAKSVSLSSYVNDTDPPSKSKLWKNFRDWRAEQKEARQKRKQTTQPIILPQPTTAYSMLEQTANTPF